MTSINCSTGSMTSASKRIFALLAVILLLIVPGCEASDFGKELYRSFARRLGRHRTDYPDLSDEQFANFRMVRTSGIGKGKLYRSSSPVSTWGERNVIADNFAREAGVRTFLNLTDTASGVKGQAGFAGSYYSTQKVIALGLDMKFSGRKFRSGLAEGIREMSRNEAPFLVHCSLGRDRAGYVCAMIECLMGAKLWEVVGDYMISYYNYFGFEPGSREYEFLVKNEVRKYLAQAFGVKDEELERINLADGAERYFRGIGVDEKEITAFRKKLADD